MQADLKSQHKDKDSSVPQFEIIDGQSNKPVNNDSSNYNKKNSNNRTNNRPQLTAHDTQFINHISYLSQVRYHLP